MLQLRTYGTIDNQFAYVMFRNHIIVISDTFNKNNNTLRYTLHPTQNDKLRLYVTKSRAIATPMLMLTTIADAVSLLHADLAQVLTPGVPIEHAELINEKKLQPAISTLAWHSGSGQASHGSSGGSSLQSASV